LPQLQQIAKEIDTMSFNGYDTFFEIIIENSNNDIVKFIRAKLDIRILDYLKIFSIPDFENYLSESISLSTRSGLSKVPNSQIEEVIRFYFQTSERNKIAIIRNMVFSKIKFYEAELKKHEFDFDTFL